MLQCFCIFTGESSLNGPWGAEEQNLAVKSTVKSALALGEKLYNGFKEK